MTKSVKDIPPAMLEDVLNALTATFPEASLILTIGYGDSAVTSSNLSPEEAISYLEGAIEVHRQMIADQSEKAKH